MHSTAEIGHAMNTRTAERQPRSTPAMSTMIARSVSASRRNMTNAGVVKALKVVRHKIAKRIA
jgi:hypothetical protein